MPSSSEAQVRRCKERALSCSQVIQNSFLTMILLTLSACNHQTNTTDDYWNYTVNSQSIDAEVSRASEEILRWLQFGNLQIDRDQLSGEIVKEVRSSLGDPHSILAIVRLFPAWAQLASTPSSAYTDYYTMSLEFGQRVQRAEACLVTSAGKEGEEVFRKISPPHAARSHTDFLSQLANSSANGLGTRPESVRALVLIYPVIEDETIGVVCEYYDAGDWSSEFEYQSTGGHARWLMFEYDGRLFRGPTSYR